MEGMGASWTMAHLLAEEASQIALRVFLLDNSGSTCKPDGHVLQKTHLGETMQVPSSRWDEIGRDFVTVDPAMGDPKQQVDRLAQLLKRNGPRGPTPLAQRIRQLNWRLQREDEFMRELRGFVDHLNAFVVIRLATDDDEVVKYYNRIDEELELPLDILDDLTGEAKELHEVGNGWFAYTPLLHRIREGGALNKLFDLLDERALKLPEIAEMLEPLNSGNASPRLLFRHPEDPPFPRCPRALYALAQSRMGMSSSVFNGHRQCMTPPVDLKALKRALGLSSWPRLRAELMKTLLCAKMTTAP
eukprot:g3787.t1